MIELIRAGDNGEHFFRYLNKKKPTDIEPYFIIQQNCTDYGKLKDLKNIYSLDSNGYYELFLKADKIISSTSNFWIIIHLAEIVIIFMIYFILIMYFFSMELQLTITLKILIDIEQILVYL